MDSEISKNLLISIGLVTITIFLAFWIFKNFLLPIVAKKSKWHFSEKLFSKIEIIVWAVFCLIAVYWSLQSSIITTSIFLLLFLVGGWSFWNDFFLGLIFRFSEKFQKEDIILLGNGIKGKINTFGMRSLELISSSGESIFLPYRKLNTTEITKKSAQGKLFANTFTLTINNEKSQEINKKIKLALLNCPWTICNQPIKIEQISATEFTISAFVFDTNINNKQQRFVEKKVNSK